VDKGLDLWEAYDGLKDVWNFLYAGMIRTELGVDIKLCVWSK